MSLPTTFPLKAANGKTITIPAVGYGTWASGDNSWAKDAVVTALKEGYRHLDCAWFYGVDRAVGEAIRESGVPRDQIFITSKFWPNFAAPDAVGLCLDKVLDAMGLEYVDLWLAHWPVAFAPSSHDGLRQARSAPDASKADMGIAVDGEGKNVVDWEHCTARLARAAGQRGSFVPTFQAMQECVRRGKARSIGVSNFTAHEISELLPHEADVPVACNQVEVHPWLPQNELIRFCKSHEILVTCYRPFSGAKGDSKSLLQDETVKRLAGENGMDVGQLLQSWAVQRGTVPLGKSATPARIKSNLDVRHLSDEIMSALDALEVPGGQGRTVNMGDSWGVALFQE